MNYKDVFALAESKGCQIDRNAVLMIEEYDKGKFKQAFKRTLLIEITLIQQHLREKHKIDITVENQFEYAEDGTWYFATVIKKGQRRTLSSYQDTPYEKALLHGIYQALQLI